MDSLDIRWKQRFSNYKKAIQQLKKFMDRNDLNELEEQGMIQSFETTYELAWNVSKDFFYFKGYTTIIGSRDAITEAYKNELIVDGEKWMLMIKTRIATSHTYNEELLKEIIQKIRTSYYNLFLKFAEKMQTFI